MSMNPKILVVGASSDIGISVTERLIKDGYHVLATHFTRNEALNTLKDKLSQVDNRLKLFPLDVRAIDQINQFFKQKTLLKNLQGLVYLPSIEHQISLIDLTPELLLDVYQVNFFSAVFLYQNFAKHLILSNSPGSIVGLSSEITRFGGNLQFTYVASKNSLNMLTMVSAKEWGPYNIRVNAVSPGRIAAGANRMREQVDPYPAPLGRYGSVSEVANTVAWLLSDQASYITGAVIPVNGGR